MAKHIKSVFIFRRDLRLDDNLALLSALKKSISVIPIFIIDPEQVRPKSSQKSRFACIQFMVESLHSLDRQLGARGCRLNLFYGKPSKVISNILSSLKIEAVYVGTDYTPYSRERDIQIEKVCKLNNVMFSSIESELLHPIGTICKPDGSSYRIYTPFSKAALRIQVPSPIKNLHHNYSKIKFDKNNWKILDGLYIENKNVANVGGRGAAVVRLKSASKYQKNYTKQRDMLNMETTMLSPYLRFGCISVREVWHFISRKLPNEHTLLKQLLWREFYYNVASNDQSIFTISMQPAFRHNIPWNTNKNDFLAWKTGKTGFPIVDAAMHQLLQTGYMHGRARMISASFLVKVLHINWVDGERWFAQHLLDYDRVLNAMNWQWVAGTGLDWMPNHGSDHLIHGDRVSDLILIQNILKNGFQHYQMWNQMTFIYGMKNMMIIKTLNIQDRCAIMPMRLLKQFMYSAKQ
jgi:deoxyribodipyrimidine photo-lyase